MTDLKKNLATVHKRLRQACERVGRDPAEVTLIAVSKYSTVGEALALRDLGVEDFGENRLPGALEKAAALSPARTHFIGHLQTNKVTRVVGAFCAIHSLDRESLLEALVRQAGSLGIVQPVFVQVNVSGEGSKGGIPPERVPDFVTRVRAESSLELKGLMTMAPIKEDPEQTRPVFRTLAELARHNEVEGLSMGMSQDFEVAVEEGATHVRIGSVLFGS